MRIDLRANAYPELMQAAGVLLVHSHAMEEAIPRVFAAAMSPCSAAFKREVFEVVRGIDNAIRLTTAAVREGAPAFLDQWQALATRARKVSERRGWIAHPGLSIDGGGLVVEFDDNGNAISIEPKGTPTASLFKDMKDGPAKFDEETVAAFASEALAIANTIGALAASITLHRKRSPTR